MHKIIEINQIYFIKYQKKQHSFNWRYSRRRLQSQLGRIRSWLIYSKTFFESSFPCRISLVSFLMLFQNFLPTSFRDFCLPMPFRYFQQPMSWIEPPNVFLKKLRKSWSLFRVFSLPTSYRVFRLPTWFPVPSGGLLPIFIFLLTSFWDLHLPTTFRDFRLPTTLSGPSHVFLEKLRKK